MLLTSQSLIEIHCIVVTTIIIVLGLFHSDKFLLCKLLFVSLNLF